MPSKHGDHFMLGLSRETHHRYRPTTKHQFSARGCLL
jgi:hypothetical protein